MSKSSQFSRRSILKGATATAALLSAARAALPNGAFAQGAGVETKQVKLGFIALTDASPLIIAKERGLFAKYGMPDIEVLKQASWAGTRDNLVLGSGGGGIDGAAGRRRSQRLHVHHEQLPASRRLGEGAA